jgi:hypothetical protein
MSTSPTANRNHWYLFLLFPFVSFIIALKNYRNAWSKNIFWAFIVFFGFTFGLAKETSTGEEVADVFRYADELKEFHAMDMTLDKIVELYSNNEDIDVVKLTISIVLSGFTDNLQVLLAVYGLIFGFFYSRNMWFVLERLNGKLRFLGFLLLASYLLVNPFWNINGFRFHTATHVFIYGLLPFLYEGRKSKLPFCFAATLVHFSFVLPVLILLTYLVLRNRTVVYFTMFLFSTAISEINITTLNAFIEQNVPAEFAKRTSDYRKEDRVEEYREGTKDGVAINISWHARYYLKALHWSLMAALIVLFLKRKKLAKVSTHFLSAYSFSLLFWSVANLMSSLPSGSRFLAIASLILLPLCILFVQNIPKDKILTPRLYWVTPLLILFVIVSIRVGFYSLSVNTILGNPLVALITNTNLALNDLIK